MFPRLRSAILTMLLGLAQLSSHGVSASLTAAYAASVWLAASGGEAQAGADQVYRYKGRDGRAVFTNAGNVAVQGAPPTAVDLPKLEDVDLTTANRDQLQLLDRTVQLTHEQLQNGRRCAAIRASLRVPTRAYWWPDHLREICVAAVLALGALALMLSWNGRLKVLLPLVPLIAASYLAYVTHTRVDARLDVLRDGLAACTSDLPASLGANALAVKERLASESTLEAQVMRAYELRATGM